MDLTPHRIPGLPPTAYYIPSFISEAEEEYLLRKVRLQRSTESPRVEQLLMFSYCLPTDYRVSVAEMENGRNGPNLVERIANITDVFRLQETETAESDSPQDGRPNQLLINVYSAGQGISPHEDGAAYHPAVATLSLGSGQCLDLYQYLSETDPSPPLTNTMRDDVNIPSKHAAGTDDSPTKPKNGKAIAAVPLARVFLEPRSLFIMTGSLYQSHLHGISFSETDILTSLSAVRENTSTPAHEGGNTETSQTSSSPLAVPVANLPLLGDPQILKTIESEGSYRSERKTRVSLTFRKVERVLKGGLRAGMGKGLFGRGRR
ncbi:hypothetical protein QFC19_000712 [Naganishia cerealis]|uniref:Uncharacterized protein n=1 Tax=Naganishia cerealis TaxID=610337 RepID=A0ACC2WLK3_9TREE|nr:hypothetical protein QFC19_000712 [Naganishia cerealis]